MFGDIDKLALWWYHKIKERGDTDGSIKHEINKKCNFKRRMLL